MTDLTELYMNKELHAKVVKDFEESLSMEEMLDIASDNAWDDVFEGFYLSNISKYKEEQHD